MTDHTIATPTSSSSHDQPAVEKEESLKPHTPARKPPTLQVQSPLRVTEIEEELEVSLMHVLCVYRVRIYSCKHSQIEDELLQSYSVFLDVPRYYNG